MTNKIKFIIAWLFLGLTINQSNSQSFFDDYERIVNSQNKVANDFKVDSLVNMSYSKDSIFSAISIIHDYSLKYYSKKKYSKGLKYVLWEKKLYEEKNIGTKSYINVLFNAGLFSYQNAEYKNSLSFFNQVIEKDTFNFRVKNAYDELGRVYNKLGNYNESIEFFIQRTKSFKENKDYVGLISTYINMSTTYKNIGTEKNAIESLRILTEADSLALNIQISANTYLNLQSALARAYTNNYTYNFKRAKLYHEKNLKLGYKYKHSAIITSTLNNLSYLYNLEKKDSARYFIKEGFKYANFPEAKARLYDNLAEYQIRKGQIRESLKSIHTSLEIITNSEIDDIIPTNYQINKSILKDYTLYCLKKKVEIYLRLYLKNKDKNNLENAINNIESAEYVVNLLLNGTTEQSTQLIWRREASQAYLYGAYAAHLLGDSETAFSFMEKNKALLLSEGILKNTEFANLPKHISDQETKLKKQIYELENTLIKSEDNTVLQDSLFNTKRIHESYVDSLKTVYPKYFARKIDVSQVSLAEVKKELGNKDAVVSYIWNEFDADKELIIGFITTKDKSVTFEVSDVEGLKAKISTYQNLVSKPFSTKEEKQSFQKVAYELYQNLFPSKEIQNLIKGKNLLIIPDGNLQNIPFESLITQKYSDEYLILNGNVNYSYSYSFLKHNEKVQRKTSQDFIAYSPVDFENTLLSSLNNSREEVEEINVELEGVIRIQDTATKEDFLINSSESKIIHLATHADAGENPWIAFADEKLELHELYTYKNNADLVTLSACNTSLGEVAKGEGVLSLARGFFYSGSKSVVSSLWEVNDKSTSEIMTNFYKNLKEGQTKSEAINNAKREYLSNHSLSEQSPYYWSSFILIGDAGKVDLANNSYLYIFLIVVVLVAILFFRKKIKIFG